MFVVLNHSVLGRKVSRAEGARDDAARLRAAGMRVTPARLAILDVVTDGRHPGVGEVASDRRVRRWSAG
jgi:hypothetical protein